MMLRGSKLRRWSRKNGLAGAALLLTAVAGASEVRDLSEVETTISELDLAQAGRRLAALDSRDPAVAVERARLALYRGDCITAHAVLSAPRVVQRPDSRAMAEVAETCAGATAESIVVEDPGSGVWVRVQDDADRVLVPLLVDVAVRARATVAADLGVHLPRPLRIDLVRDQFSLAMVSGLPIQAAQTTGTVAVARWGRVIMVSPRATPMGFPWQDTMAHEIVHLALSRASADRAPLWLQEGVAKREETRWRTARPLDDRARYTQQAREALLAGQNVGIDRLGLSIAMLPTPEAASTAYAEVASFMQYWIEQNGWPALELLLMDLRSLATAEAALRSVTGHGLDGWILLWKQHLISTPAPTSHESSPEAPLTREFWRLVRLGDLLQDGGFAGASVGPLRSAVERAPERAAVRHRLAKALLASGQPESAQEALGELESLDGLHAGWLGTSGSLHLELGELETAAMRFGEALGIQPLLEQAACGRLDAQAASGGRIQSLQFGPTGDALCEAAKAYRLR